VACVRAFNRFWTAKLGVLAANLHQTPFSLAEARVIFELAQREEADVADLRERLGLDRGYLSRILAQFKARKLVALDKSAADVRRKVVRLTAQGRAAFRTLDSRASREVTGLLQPLGEGDRSQLVRALEKVESLLTPVPRPQPYVIRPLRPGDYGWIVSRHGALYAEEYGWDMTFEALVARILADFGEKHDAKRECGWIAEVEGEPVGCVFCVKKDAKTAQLRILLVEPRARGLGIGGRLVDECLRFARQAGYKRIMLWTNSVLNAARRIYQRAGFQLDEEEKHHSFGVSLVSQIWSRDL
jgi:DNA-binding MarR family transcriptional regulator/GNAT superfamily N-acetyltransferase